MDDDETTDPCIAYVDATEVAVIIPETTRFAIVAIPDTLRCCVVVTPETATLPRTSSN